MTEKTDELVRYVTPYGSTTWLTRSLAESYLAIDRDRWKIDDERDSLTLEQRRIGPPRIETAKR